MSPSRAFCTAVVTVLVAIGCADESTTGVSVPETELPTDLAFTFPDLTPEALAHTVVEEVEPASGPARAFADEPDRDPGDEPDTDVVSRIWGASTKVGVTSEYAYSTGRHSYSGNTGKVTTELVVSMDGQEIGRKPATRQNYRLFLQDMGQIHEIWAEAYLFTDQECGLTVDGSSGHWAWWQWFMGTSAPHWGESYLTSQAFPPYSQPGCVENPGSYTGGDNATGSDGGGGVTCWYWVTYDPYTGEVYDAQFLFCDDVEGG